MEGITTFNSYTEIILSIKNYATSIINIASQRSLSERNQVYKHPVLTDFTGRYVQDSVVKEKSDGTVSLHLFQSLTRAKH